MKEEPARQLLKPFFYLWNRGRIYLTYLQAVAVMSYTVSLIYLIQKKICYFYLEILKIRKQLLNYLKVSLTNNFMHRTKIF
uniref:Uncharacterized protein n=1 Tax=Myoviridae sp. ct2798 TaxID=2827285 RepID=A0A8S5R5B9_9CAUD|nr:MAG TPA: hypothetical protein [Myoviridae sp. ct2798]